MDYTITCVATFDDKQKDELIIKRKDNTYRFKKIL